VPVYQYELAGGKRFERLFPMGDAPPAITTEVGEAMRVFGDFNFVEDRTRFFRNPRTGTRFSDVLGCEMPEDRVSRDALYASKGAEPVSAREMPSQWKTALEYSRHLDTGGNKLDRKEEAKLIESPDFSGVKSIKQMVQESDWRMPG
jgi:hypothetical protein